MSKTLVLSLCLLLSLGAVLATGCARGVTAPPEPTASGETILQSPLSTPAPAVMPTVKMALIPVLDILPYYMAVENGYFDQVGIRVEALPVQGPQERDSLMQTGQIDGMLTDLISPLLFNQKDVMIKSVLVTRKVYPGEPVFRVVASPNSGIKSPADAAGKAIASSMNSVSQYLTERMLEKAGLRSDQIVIENVPAIPVRFELLMNDQVAAAFLPDPQASGAIAAGAVAVVEDTLLPDLSASNLVFSTKSLTEKSEAVRAFVKAWLMAVQELNKNPDKYRDLLIEKGRVPESIQGTFQMPRFPEGGVPTAEQFADIIQWALKKGIIQNDVPYESMVDASFLP